MPKGTQYVIPSGEIGIYYESMNEKYKHLSFNEGQEVPAAKVGCYNLTYLTGI